MEMELSLLVSWVSILLLALPGAYVLYSTIRSRSPPGMPPSPPGWRPVIGHLHLMTDMPHMALAEMAKSMRAPLFHVQLGSIAAVVISKPDLARAALTTHDVSLSSRPQLLAGQVLAFGCSDVASSPEGPYHRMARGVVVSELSSARRVAAFSGVRGKEVRRLLAFVAKAETTVDVSACVRNLANDVFCLVAFGRRFPQGKEDKLNAVIFEAQNLYGGFTLGDFFPELEPIASTLTGLRRRLNNCLADLEEICGEFFEEHRTGKHKRITFPGGGRNEDFIDVLLRVQKSSSLDIPLTDDNVMSIVVDQFIAATDTSATTMDWVMTELLRHPRVLHKAQDEIRRVAGAKGHVEESDLGELRYLRAVIKEIFRLHPPVPLLIPRESVLPCSLGGYDIPAKTRVYINTFAMGRDPEIWENPLQFSPKRFDTDAGGKIIDLMEHDYRMLPFGGGRRGCPGIAFAQSIILLGLSSLLFHFDWALPPGVRVEDVSLEETFGLATTRTQPLLVAVTKNPKYEFKGAELDEI